MRPGLPLESSFVGLGRGGAGEGRMRSLGVIEVEPVSDGPLGGEAVGQLVQIHGLVFERAPEAFDEDVVHASASAVHGDGDA